MFAKQTWIPVTKERQKGGMIKGWSFHGISNLRQLIDKYQEGDMLGGRQLLLPKDQHKSWAAPSPQRLAENVTERLRR
jgi:hypothetical protein